MWREQFLSVGFCGEGFSMRQSLVSIEITRKQLPISLENTSFSTSVNSLLIPPSWGLPDIHTTSRAGSRREDPGYVTHTTPG